MCCVLPLSLSSTYSYIHILYTLSAYNMICAPPTFDHIANTHAMHMHMPIYMLLPSELNGCRHGEASLPLTVSRTPAPAPSPGVFLPPVLAGLAGQTPTLSKVLSRLCSSPGPGTLQSSVLPQTRPCNVESRTTSYI